MGYFRGICGLDPFGYETEKDRRFDQFFNQLKCLRDVVSQANVEIQQIKYIDGISQEVLMRLDHVQGMLEDGLQTLGDGNFNL